MLKRTAKIATLAIAGTLVFGGSAFVAANAESVYNSTAIAGITLSVDDYVASVEDEAPAVVSTQNASGEASTSKKNAKFVAANVEDVVNVRKKGGMDYEVIGQMYRGDTGKLLKKGNYWSKIQSGNVKGWVRNDFLLFGDEAREYADSICTKIATVNTETLNVRLGKSTETEIVTLIPQGGEYEVKKVSKDGDWVKISIDGDLKGYVAAEFVDIEVDYGEALTMEEIRAAEAAQAAQAATVTVEEQVTTSSSSTSVSSIKPTTKSTISNGTSFSNSSSSSTSTSTSGLGSQIASYACQFVGNPYVYGGTSLTNGTDCSGFTMSVYAHFGYSLPRTAASQASAYRSVSMSELQPGDLIFYKNGGGIGHVALYIGNGTVVHASNRKDGIKYSGYNYRSPCKAVRVIG